MKRVGTAAIAVSLLSALLFLIVWRLTRRPLATDLVSVRANVRLAWLVAGSAWVLQYALVGAAARALVTARGSGRVLLAALRGFAFGALPAGAAAVAVLVGGLALAVPGLVLLVLFAFVGASEGATIRDALVDSAARVRQAPLGVIAIVAVMLAVDLGVVALLLHHGAPLGKKPSVAALVTYRNLVRNVVVVLAVASPVFALLLGQRFVRSQRSR